MPDVTANSHQPPEDRFQAWVDALVDPDQSCEMTRLRPPCFAAERRWSALSISMFAVARAAGLHCSRVDGSPLVYNADDTSLPDLIVCRPELAEQIVDFVRRHGTD